MSKTTIKTLTQQLTDEQFLLYRKMVDEHERYATLSEQQKRELLENILCRPYMDLLCDWAFKHVFGHDKEALMMLLHDLLPLDIIDIEYESNELDRLHADAKASTMDVVCKLASNERVIVEMQHELRKDFHNRMFFYGAASSIEPVKRGGDYSSIRSVYLICFTDYILKHTICPKDKLVFVYDFLEQETGEPYGDHPYFSIRFCELPRLVKTDMSEMTLVEQWFHLLKNIRTFALNPKDVPVRYQRILKSAQLAQITEEDRQNYLKNMLSEYDVKMISLGNYERGHSDAAEEIARRMLEEGDSLERVTRITGLTEKQVKSLVAQSSIS